MKISHSGVFVLLLFSLSVLAQTRTARRPRESQLPEPEPPSCTVANWENGGRTRTWPRSYNSATVRFLSSIKLSMTHKLKLIDYGAEMEKQDLKLQTTLDADIRNEGRVEAQADQVLSARGKLEREFTMMTP